PLATVLRCLPVFLRTVRLPPSSTLFPYTTLFRSLLLVGFASVLFLFVRIWSLISHLLVAGSSMLDGMSLLNRDKSKRWLRIAEKRGVDTSGHVGVWSLRPEGARTVTVLFDDRVVVSRGGRAAELAGYGSDLTVVQLEDVAGVASSVEGFIGWVGLWGKGFEHWFPVPRRVVKDVRARVDAQIRGVRS